jgi:hypothetical protein
VQTESDKEQKGWTVISGLKESWCYNNIGFELTLKILEKNDKYRLMLSQPANQTEDMFLELHERPIKWLKELEELPHNEYKVLLGIKEYGETYLEGIAIFLGVRIVSQFKRSNIS